MNETINSGEMTCSTADYKPSKDDSKMESIVLVSEQDIIATYQEAEQISCKQYGEYLDLIKGNPTIGYKCCAKLLGVSPGRTRWWHTKGAKHAIPLPLKATQKLKQVGLLPFYENHKDSELIFNILGTLFGDGGIDIRYNTVAFISSDKNDIDLWHSDLLKIFPFARGKTNLVEGGEYGHSYNIRCYDRAVVRFFAALGAPVGNKVTTPYSLPQWLFNSTKESKSAFLDGYLASEVSVVRYVPNFFADFALGVSKIEFLEKEHREFLKNIENLLESVKIFTTGNIYKSTSAAYHRKDGAFTANYRIFICTDFKNVLSFNKQFQLRYARAKKERFEQVIKTGTYQKNGWQQPDNYNPDS